MRIAFLSDTHGNITALQAVLDDIKTQGVDDFVFLGDAATIGSHPNETLDALRARASVCIIGNHDEAVLHPDHVVQMQIAEPLYAPLEWCIRRLTRVNVEFLKSFQKTREVKLDGGPSILCFHGSPRASTELLFSTTPLDAVKDIFAGQSAEIWVGGHTHLQMVRRIGDKMLFNPGSVGHAFHHPYIPGQAPQLLPWAEYAILTVEGETIGVDLRRVPFDVDTVVRLIAESGIPDTEGRRSLYWTAEPSAHE